MNERASLHPISLRVTFEEKANLEKAAAGMSLSAFIRWKLFDPSSPPPHRRGAFPVKDHRALAQLLAMLGQSRLANNVNQLAKAANTGWTCNGFVPVTYFTMPPWLRTRAG